jgi:hypothetical protein
MSLRIEQYSSYLGRDRWAWKVWLAGPPTELAVVAKVYWHLHPSFTPSVVEVTDPSDGFALETSGWGTFELRALVKRRDGNELTLSRELELYYPDDADDPVLRRDKPRRVAHHGATPRAAPAPAPAPQPAQAANVYLSYGAEDRSRAMEVRQVLESLGAKVVDGSRLPPGVPVQHAVYELIAGSRCVVALLSSEWPGQWIAEELALAQRFGRPLLLLATPQVQHVVGLPPNLPLTHMSSEQPAALREVLAKFLGV